MLKSTLATGFLLFPLLSGCAGVRAPARLFTEWGWLGVDVAPVTSGDPQGVRVTGFEEGSPAETRGIRIGDRIVRFAGTRIDSRRTFWDRLAETDIGESVTIEILRDGTPYEADVMLGRRPSLPFRVGVEVEQLRGRSPEEGARVAAVQSASPAGEAGLADRDRIVALDGAEVVHPEDLWSKLTPHAPGDRVTVEVIRDGRRLGFELVLSPIDEALVEGTTTERLPVEAVEEPESGLEQVSPVGRSAPRIPAEEADIDNMIAEAVRLMEEGQFDLARELFDEILLYDLGFWQRRRIAKQLARLDAMERDPEPPAQAADETPSNPLPTRAAPASLDIPEELTPDIIRFLVMRLGEPDGRMHYDRIRRALGRARPEHLPVFAAIWEEGEASDLGQAAMAYALGRIEGETAGLLAEMIEGLAPETRRQAALSIARLDLPSPPPEILDAVRTALDDESGVVQMAAARAASTLADREAVPSLLRLLRDPLPEVRIEGARALERLGSPEGEGPDAGWIAALTDLLNDPFPGVRAAAGDALDAIGVRERDALAREADRRHRDRAAGAWREEFGPEGR